MFSGTLSGWTLTHVRSISRQVLCKAPETGADGVRVHPYHEGVQRAQLEDSQGHDVRSELPALADGDGF